MPPEVRTMSPVLAASLGICCLLSAVLVDVGAQEQVTLKGQPLELAGTRVAVGHEGRAFTTPGHGLPPGALADFSGRPILISVVPSVDTPVCSLQTRRFNQDLATLPKEVALLTISMDLPSAQKRFCGEADIERMQLLSDSARREFGQAYGLYLPSRGLLARAVLVIDRSGTLSYRQLVPELSAEPDYGAALDAIRAAAGSAP
jgi:thiol peroxidase